MNDVVYRVMTEASVKSRMLDRARNNDIPVPRTVPNFWCRYILKEFGLALTLSVARLAQSVARKTSNLEAVGSSPTLGFFYVLFLITQFLFFFFFACVIGLLSFLLLPHDFKFIGVAWMAFLVTSNLFCAFL